MCLPRATGRTLNEEEKNEFLRGQLQANRWTYLGSAMTHERVLATFESLSPSARKRIEEIASSILLASGFTKEGDRVRRSAAVARLLRRACDSRASTELSPP
jgi:hypothetical protein